MSDVESLRDYGSNGHVIFTILVPRLLRVPSGRGEYVESRVQLLGRRGVEPRVFSRAVFFHTVYIYMNHLGEKVRFREKVRLGALTSFSQERLLRVRSSPLVNFTRA